MKNRVWLSMACVLASTVCSCGDAPESSKPLRVPAAPSTVSNRAQSLTSDAELVVAGKVRRVTSHDQGPSGEAGIHSRVVVAVYRTLLGSAPDEVTFWVQGGRIGNRARQLAQQAQFRKGEEVVVFLTGDSQRNFWPTRMGDGKWILERRPSEWRVRSRNVQGEGSAESVEFGTLLEVVARQGVQ